MELVGCPECGQQVAQVEGREVWESTDGPVEHVRVRCVARHLFLMPAERLEGGEGAPADGGAAALGSSAVADPFAQDTYGVRLDWGPAGARATRAVGGVGRVSRRRAAAAPPAECGR